MPPISGTRKYTERAGQQDAADAMRGDLVRGLVEIITNADDAYVRAGHDGPIRITIEHLGDSNDCTARIYVSDSATGLTVEQMKEKLTEAGSRSSNFEQGDNVRGLHGRGFGDVAVFGWIELESIKNGMWSKFELHGQDFEIKGEEDRDRPHEEIRESLGLADDECGATVTINVRRPLSVSSDIFNRLCLVAELRNIITERTVTLEETGTRPHPSRRLYYEMPPAKEVVRKAVEIPEYPEASAELVVFEMEEAQSGQVGPESHHGLMIQGGHAVYENTLFQLDRKVGSEHLTGSFSCPYIDHLIRDFDDRLERGEEPDKNNPIRLVSRSRDGLHREHPFVNKLSEVFSAELLHLIQDLARRHSGNRNPSESMQQRLDQTARELARLLSEDLAELDDDDDDNGHGPKLAPLSIIPNRVLLQPNQQKTLTIHTRPGLLNNQWDREFAVSSDVPAIVSIDGKPDPLEPHSEDPELLVSRIRITSGGLEGNAVVSIAAGEKDSACTVTVDKTNPPPPPPPAGLTFSHDRYRLRPGRQRSVEVLAPLELVGGEQNEVQVTLKGDPTIKLLSETCGLRLDSERGWYSSRVKILGEVADASGTLTATYKSHRAKSKVNVVDPTDPHGLDLQINWADQAAGHNRAALESSPSGLVLTIYGQHSAIASQLGGYDEELQAFENEKDPRVSLVLAEIMATEITHFLLERLFNRLGVDCDAPGYAFRYRQRLGKYLTISQRMLIDAD